MWWEGVRSLGGCIKGTDPLTIAVVFLIYLQCSRFVCPTVRRRQNPSLADQRTAALPILVLFGSLPVAQHCLYSAKINENDINDKHLIRPKMNGQAN